MLWPKFAGKKGNDMTLHSILDLLHLSMAGANNALGKAADVPRARTAGVLRVDDRTRPTWMVNLPEATSCTAWQSNPHPPSACVPGAGEAKNPAAGWKQL